MLLQHINTNVTALTQISDSHFEKTEAVMKHNLHLLETIRDHNNVLNKVLLNKQDASPRDHYYIFIPLAYVQALHHYCQMKQHYHHHFHCSIAVVIMFGAIRTSPG